MLNKLKSIKKLKKENQVYKISLIETNSEREKEMTSSDNTESNLNENKAKGESSITFNEPIKDNTRENKNINSKKEKPDNISNSASDESEKDKKQKVFINSQTALPEEKSYTSRLVTSIPIKITIEFDRKAKVQSIIEAVKNLKELELEKTNNFTNLVLIGYNLNFIDTEFKIDECFQNNQTVDIYEFLNFNGLNEIIWKSKSELENLIKKNSDVNGKNINNNISNTGSTYASESEILKKNSDKNCVVNNSNKSSNSNINYNTVGKNYQNQIDIDREFVANNNSKDDILPICYDTLKYFRMPILDYNVEHKDKKFEYLVEINHRFVTEKEYYIFNQATFNQMHNFFFDAMLLNNSAVNLINKFCKEKKLHFYSFFYIVLIFFLIKE